MRVKPMNYADAGGLSRLESGTFHKRLGNLSNAIPLIAFETPILFISIRWKNLTPLSYQIGFDEKPKI